MEDLFGGMDPEKQALQLRKVLILAGVDVETEMGDAETMDII